MGESVDWELLTYQYKIRKSSQISQSFNNLLTWFIFTEMVNYLTNLKATGISFDLASLIC